MTIKSDVNYTQSVSMDDLTIFLENWFAGEDAADTNLDGVVDQTDLTQFMANFTNGT